MNESSQPLCDCGLITGEYCQWDGQGEKLVTVEYMPEQFRSSHEAAGNSGVFPCNGSVRIKISEGCYSHLKPYQGEWMSLAQ